MKEHIQLSDHFDIPRLIRFTLPTIGMMIIVSIYSSIDGIFVSNFVGTTPFAAVNMTYPILCVVSAFGFMMASGGSALVSKVLGEGDPKRANDIFSMVVVFSFIIIAVLSAIGFIFTPQLCALLGAEGDLLDYCIIYGKICFIGIPFVVLQSIFLSFFVTAEKPKLSLSVNIAAGLTNFLLDALFIIVFKWGIAGAAAATVVGQMVGGIVPMIYFMRPNDSLLSFKPSLQFEKKAFLKTLTNGSSEMVSNLSVSFVGILYNFQFMRLAGEAGVSAFGAVDYTMYLYMSVFWGYASGTLPVIGYHYGAQNKRELKSLFKNSLLLMGAAGILMLVVSQILAVPFSALFLRQDPDIMEMCVHGFRIYLFGFILMGVNVFASTFFTGLNNGKVSAFLSLMRTIVIKVAVIIVMPVFYGLDGLWLSFPVGEAIALIFTLICFAKYAGQYGYI